MKLKLYKYLLLIILFLLPKLSATNSFFSDIEIVALNEFKVGNLQIALFNSDDSALVNPFFDKQLNYNELISKSVKIINTGSIDSKYKISTNLTSGNQNLFDALTLKASKNANLEFNGYLKDFNLDFANLNNEDLWDFELSLNDNNPVLQNQLIDFEIIFHAFQQNSDGTWGFSDIKFLTNHISSDDWTSPAKPSGLDIFKTHDPSTGPRIGCGGTTNSTQITIYWDQNTESDIDYYWFGTKFTPKHRKVFYSDHEYHANMTPGNNPYYYTVIAVDKDGQESPISDKCYLYLNENAEIVINEFLPDPIGGDSDAMPNGEWVELYNRSNTDVDVSGWNLYDDYDSHRLPITADNTHTGSTIIPPGGYLVVYKNGDSDFSLNQDPGTERVRLFAGNFSTGILKDSHTYEGPVEENKSIARIPDGYGPWVDPIPTPGQPNKLESNETSLDFYFQNNKKEVGFDLNNISIYQTLKYEIIWNPDNRAFDPVKGEIKLNNENTISRQNIMLGWVSDKGSEVYDTGIEKINIKITLSGIGLLDKILEKQLEY